MGSGEALMRQTPNTKSVGKEWQGRKDSNLGPSVLESPASNRRRSAGVDSEYEQSARVCTSRRARFYAWFYT